MHSQPGVEIVGVKRRRNWLFLDLLDRVIKEVVQGRLLGGIIRCVLDRIFGRSTEQEHPPVLYGLVLEDLCLILCREKTAVRTDEVEKFGRVPLQLVERLVAQALPEVLDQKLPRHLLQCRGVIDHHSYRMVVGELEDLVGALEVARLGAPLDPLGDSRGAVGRQGDGVPVHDGDLTGHARRLHMP